MKRIRKGPLKWERRDDIAEVVNDATDRGVSAWKSKAHSCMVSVSADRTRVNLSVRRDDGGRPSPGVIRSAILQLAPGATELAREQLPSGTVFVVLSSTPEERH